MAKRAIPFQRLAIQLFTLSLVLQLPACASLKHQCEPETLKEIKPGTCDTFEVDASRYWNHSGFLLTKGTYHLTVVHQCKTADGQCRPWRDKGCPATPEGGWSSDRCGFLSEKFTRNFARNPQINMFALACSAGRDEAIAKAIGHGTELKADKAVELVCFANDVAFMYFNNSGNVAVQACRNAD